MTGAIELIEDNEIAFSTACGWVLFDPEDRSGLLEDLLSDVIPEILPSEALAVDGLEDHPVLIEALEKSLHYESLPLKGKINYWEDPQNNRRSYHKWPKLGVVCSTGNNVSIIAYR